MTPFSVSTPDELLAAVPYLVGFHPENSLVVVAVRGDRVHFAARYDLPDPADERHARGEPLDLAMIVTRENVDGVALVGYGPEPQVTPAVQRSRDALRRLGVLVLDALRVTDRRYWSYICDDLGCCPPEGTPCPPEHSAMAAAATFAGHVALPDRDALIAQIAPVTGTAREAMAAATARAQGRMTDLLARDLSGSRDGSGQRGLDGQRGPDGRPDLDEIGFSRLVRRAGRTAVRGAERRYRWGRRLSDDEVAWLGLLLVYLPVRDYAWERTDPAEWRTSLWMDVLRRVEPGYVSAPACLLSFAAWRLGLGALARVAVERALAHDREYGMAQLLDEILRCALSPAMVADWPEVDGSAFAAQPTAPASRGAPHAEPVRHAEPGQHAQSVRRARAPRVRAEFAGGRDRRGGAKPRRSSPGDQAVGRTTRQEKRRRSHRRAN